MPISRVRSITAAYMAWKITMKPMIIEIPMTTLMNVESPGMLVGGDVGPELTRIGSKVKPAWLADWLRNPKTYDPDTAMPHYRFDQKQLGPLRAFIEAKTD